MSKDESEDLTPVEANQLVDEHEGKHGKVMEPTREDERKGIGRHDLPTDEDLDAEPEWSKRGEKLEDQPEGDED